MRRIFWILFGMIFLLSSCEDSDLVFTGSVSASFDGENVEIQNGLHYTIYFMILEENCAELVVWTPLTDGPNFIEGGHSRQRSLSEIENCVRDAAVTSGDTLMIYWWKDAGDDQEVEVTRIVLNL